MPTQDWAQKAADAMDRIQESGVIHERTDRGLERPLFGYGRYRTP